MSEKINDRIDEFEAALLENFPVVDCPVRHRFTPGLYIREIFMPAGITVTSLIHDTIHPFCILQGKVIVFNEEEGTQELQAPLLEITYPNTRRILQIVEDTVWVTFHPTDIVPESASEEDIQKAVDKICRKIIRKHENKILGGVLKNNVITPLIENDAI